MKSTPVLRITLQSSRIAATLLALATIATAAMLALLPGEPWLRAASVLVAAACGIQSLRTTAAIGINRSIASIELAADRRIVITDRLGRHIAAIVRPESYVGALLTTLVLRPEGARRSRPLAIWPDTMPADELRRLRVLLRHGDRGSDQA
ncbi:MAG: protein YgfX [Betaproteobacteria bacterium]